MSIEIYLDKCGYTRLSRLDRIAISNFALIWSLFEARLLGKNASANKIVEKCKVWEEYPGIDDEVVSPYLDYFKERYVLEGTTNYRYDHLNFRENNNECLVKNVLLGNVNDLASRLACCLIIILRFRNNYFHGEKWAYQFAEQRENFEHSCCLLAECIDKYDDTVYEGVYVDGKKHGQWINQQEAERKRERKKQQEQEIQRIASLSEDKITKEISKKTINPENISFDLIRKKAIASFPDVWDELDRGHSILTSQEQLDQYFYTYGPMVQSQWTYILKARSLNTLISDCNSVEIIDYACGQGLASMLFFDKFKKARKTVSGITLIEPSKIALDRAKIILQCSYAETEIEIVNKELDDIEQSDIKRNDNATKIHLFSNILDIDGFDINQLVNTILNQKGKNCFLAVSSDREYCGGTPRLEIFYNLLAKHSNFKEMNSFNAKGKNKDYPSYFVYIEAEL